MFSKKLKTIITTGVSAAFLIAMAVSPAKAERVILDVTSPQFAKLLAAAPLFIDLNSGKPAGEMSTKLADRLRDDLMFSASFEVVDRAKYTLPPDKTGLVSEEINFMVWRGDGVDYLFTGGFRINGDNLKLEMRVFDTVGEKFVIGKAYEGRPEDFGKMVDYFVNEVIKHFTGMAGVFGTKIAYEAKGRRGRKEIFTIDLDGTGAVQVTDTNRICRSPAWSANNERIAFTTWLRGRPEIYDVNIATGKLFPLARFSGSNLSPAFSKSGRWLAFSGSFDGNAEVYLIRSTGDEKAKRLTNHWGIDVSPSWSNDSKQLAFVSSRAGNPHIFTVDIEGGEPRRITHNGKYNSSPNWSPTGDAIAFTRQEGNNFDIYIISPEGSDERRLTENAGSNEDPSFSPDGRLIVFSSNRDGDYDLYVIESTGGPAHRLTNFPGDETKPAWSNYYPERN